MFLAVGFSLKVPARLLLPKFVWRGAKFLGATGILLLCANFVTAQSSAPVISFSSSLVSGLTPRTDGPFTLGTEIEVGSQAVTVTELGVQDGGLWSANSIEVGLWNEDGSQLLRSAVVPRTAVAEAGGYRYASITPVTLNANTKYLIGALGGGNAITQFAAFWDGNILSSPPFTSSGAGVTLVRSTYATGSSLAAPTTPGGGSHAVRWAFANMKISTASAPAAGTIFSVNFNDFTGSPTGTQYQTGHGIVSGASLVGWVKEGADAVRLVNYGATAANWAVMIQGDETITMVSGVDANTDGATYTVSFDVGPAIFDNQGQGTGADDQLAVRVIDEGNDWVEQSTVSPGAWSGSQSFFPYTFEYTGRGTGNIRLQVAAANTTASRFAGAIDNITITSATTAKTTPTLAAAPTASAITYGSSLGSATLTGGTASVAGTFAFKNPAATPGAGIAYVPSAKLNVVSANCTGAPAAPLLNPIFRFHVPPTASRSSTNCPSRTSVAVLAPWPTRP